MNTVVARCPLPHDMNRDGDIVPLESCPLCEGKAEIVVQLTDDEMAAVEDMDIPLERVS